MRLQGKVALVTGAARRVGRTIALSLARRGARVIVHYNRSRRDARRLSEEIESSFGREAPALQADLSDGRALSRLAETALRKYGVVHVLVNNASVYERTPFGKTQERAWDLHLDVNLRAPFLLSQILGPAMKRAGEGKIVNIADFSARRPYADYVPYCVSKAGLLALNTALAKALAPEVQVNAILPGPVLLKGGETPRLREAIKNATLLKRLGDPEDVARAALYLIEEADFSTGASLAVDGGRLAA